MMAEVTAPKPPDMNRLCRVCLQAKADLFSLYDEFESSSSSGAFSSTLATINIAEIMTECTRHKVDRFDDRFPHQICGDCMDQSRVAYRFKRQVERSYRQLMDWLGSDADADPDEPPKIGQREIWTQTEKLGLHPCEMCSEKFFDFIDLRQHRQKEHRDALKKCKVCSQIFKDVRALKSHLASEHPNELPFKEIQCPVCMKTFSRRDHMQRHLRNIHKMGGPNISLKSEEGDEVKKPTDSTHFLVCAEESESEVDDADADVINPISSDDEKYDMHAFMDAKMDIKVEPIELGGASGSKFGGIQDTITTEMLHIPSFDLAMAKRPKKEARSADEDDTDFDSCDDDEDFEPMHDSGASEPEKEQTTTTTESKATTVKKVKKEVVEVRSPPRRKVKIERIDGGSGVGSGLNVIAKPARRRRSKGESSTENRCEQCQRTFTRYCHLKRHMATHLEEKPFACEVCAKRFTRSDHLRKHIAGVHGTKEYKCDQCGVELASSGEVLKHKVKEHGADPNENKNFECEFCLKRFGTLKYLGKHRLMHTDRVFACRHCDETFQDRKVFREHEKTHIKEQRNFLCSICGDSFQRSEYLKIHMRRHTGEKPYKCKFCGKGFPRATDLNQHERYHTGHKPNICTLCGKAFHRAYNLTIHMRTHTGERPFQCDHCPKSFAQGNDLKAHIRRHTGERYKCSECDAGFLQLYAMRQHALSAHGIEIEPKTGRLQKFPTLIPTQNAEQQQHLPPLPQHTTSAGNVSGLPAPLLPSHLQPLIANYMLPAMQVMPVIPESSPPPPQSHSVMNYKSV